MRLRGDHELHRRRLGRNVGVAVALVVFAAVLFGLTISKIAGGDMMQAYDHEPRASMSARTDGGQ